ncbi:MULTISPECIES: flagellar basal body P-ring formation chaperone FlgA [unclassified Caballeronia]|uniref:flagellar basal body P-ring formation chaperone FlgA n=1 Tax=unclassified Caballeronia TaxID=2646786 RepID=UPI0028666647|nr:MULTISPECIES: flagellar basal body P-ring formation chaperone FlgA [unclassified Caballeronia]MDR5752019.1 flagellar basal body P-ring formation chaperone FlgA [Caballeronia sp. LZ024]MDR5843840.1 flagellar basal body P-ring formation chaperone FlgA [Caballeronia sp. LZ031]
MSRSASHRPGAGVVVAGKALRRAGRLSGRSLRSARWFASGVALAVGMAGQAIAQEGGPIMIPGNAETNPAALSAMAKNAGMSETAAAPAVSSVAAVSAMNTPRPRGYTSAATAADAALQSAARALDAHAEAADDTMSDANGMIVIPGPGEAKSPPVVANQAPNAVSASLPRVQSVTAARAVTPVVIVPESAQASASAASASAARPIAAAAAAPVATRVAPAAARIATANPNPNPQATQDGETIRAAALAFVQQQAAGLPGKPEITVMPVFPRGLAPCTALDPFMPTGARLWGRTTVGVRCVGERPWTLYLQVRVSINATYYLAARAIAPGEVLSSADLIARDGDLTSMPQAIVTDPTQAVGAVALSRVPAGLPLRTDMLRGATSVSIGQNVRVVADGSGFSISAEGSVMNNAAPGQQVRVKTSAGQIITGVVKDSQTVEIRL